VLGRRNAPRDARGDGVPVSSAEFPTPAAWLLQEASDMDKNRSTNLGLVCYFALGLGPCSWLLPACASDQKSAATAEEVRDGEAIPPAPPLPATPAPEVTAAAPSAAAPSAAGGTGNAASTGEAATAKEPLTESQMAKVTELVNTAEIEQAKIAQRRAKAPGVKQFADKMLKHHGHALREQAKIVQRLKLTPADSATAAKVKSDGEEQRVKLKDIDTASFDAAYLTGQIDAHQQAIELLDVQLIPNAKTPEVVNALQIARQMVEQHLSEARSLRQ
jgi:putative membrane protein